MYKAVFIDIDGTLIKSDHTLSDATLNAIQKLKEKNILIVLVSARPLSAILPIVERTGLLSYPVASLNGAYIANGENKIFEATINADVAARVHEHLRQYSATPIYYEQVQWFSEVKNFATDYEQRITDVAITIQPFDDTIKYWQYRNSGPNKIQVIGKAGVINEIQDNLRQQFFDHLTISTSKATYLEVMNIGASKVNAVKLLIDHHNIKREETITIGDNFNDKEMIAFAGMGVAMGNAPAEVKAIAGLVTDTNNNDGVAKALKKLINF